MTRALFLLLVLLSFDAPAQVSLTIDGKAITKASISISTDIAVVVVPPTCTGGQILQGNACVCPAGSTWSGSICVISAPPVSGVQIIDMSWGPGKNYLQKPIQKVAGANVAAYRINAQAFLNDPSQTPGTASVQFYETGSIIACISNTPGAFLPASGLTPCLSIVGPGAKVGFSVAGPDFGASDATLAAYGWKRLPPSADGYYYINVKLPDPAGLPSTFWLLYN